MHSTVLLQVIALPEQFRYLYYTVGRTDYRRRRKLEDDQTLQELFSESWRFPLGPDSV